MAVRRPKEPNALDVLLEVPEVLLQVVLRHYPVRDIAEVHATDALARSLHHGLHARGHGLSLLVRHDSLEGHLVAGF